MDERDSAGGVLRRRSRRLTVSTSSFGADLHEPLSEMHRAIERKDFGHVLRLLDSGIGFCRGDGLNCFILAAVAPNSTAAGRWSMVKKMLDIDSRGVHARNEDGSTLLMYFCTDEHRVEHLVNMGADVNAEDKDGICVLKRMFLQPVNIPRKSEIATSEAVFRLMLCEILDVNKNDFVDYLNSYISGPDLKMRNRACVFMCAILNSGHLSIQQMTILLKMHPIFFFIELNKVHCLYMELLELYIQFGRKDCNILQDKAILITVKDTSKPTEGPVWKKVKQVLNIPDTLTFDVLGYFLYTMDLMSASFNISVPIQHLGLLLQRGFVPVYKEGVVHPIVALLYNIFQSYEDISPFCALYVLRNQQLPKLLLHAIMELKEYPIPHQLVQVENDWLTLDLVLLLTPLMVYNNLDLFECIMVFCQLSPQHQFCHLGAIWSNIKLFASPLGGSRVEFKHKLVQIILDETDSPFFQGADQKTVTSIKTFYNKLQKIHSITRQPGKLSEYTRFMNVVEKASKGVCSLQFLSILKIRKTLFLSRQSSTSSLPSQIKSLCDDGFLPRSLQNDLLIYKVNKGLKF